MPTAQNRASGLVRNTGTKQGGKQQCRDTRNHRACDLDGPRNESPSMIGSFNHCDAIELRTTLEARGQKPERRVDGIQVHAGTHHAVAERAIQHAPGYNDDGGWDQGHESSLPRAVSERDLPRHGIGNGAEPDLACKQRRSKRRHTPYPQR